MDLRTIVDALAKEPFSRQFSVVTLHDTLSHQELMQILNDVAHHIDHLGFRRPNEIADLALNLGFKDPDTSKKLSLGEDRSFVLQVLGFLLRDLPKNQHTAYMARFCGPLSLPVEYLQDDQVQDLMSQLKQSQDAFVELHSKFRELTKSSTCSSDYKRDIQQMEDEKSLVVVKIQKLQDKVKDIVRAVS